MNPCCTLRAAALLAAFVLLVCPVHDFCGPSVRLQSIFMYITCKHVLERTENENEKEKKKKRVLSPSLTASVVVLVVVEGAVVVVVVVGVVGVVFFVFFLLWGLVG